MSASIPLNPISWTAIGPAPIKGGQIPGEGHVTGRVTGIAAHPTDADIIYIAAAAGGVWKSTNGGSGWTPLTDDQATLNMGAIAVARSDPNVIYAGTGEANNGGDNYYGRGVLRSKDAGSSWELLGTAHFDRRTISKIAIDHTDADIVYTAVAGAGANGLGGNTGIWQSTDGGTEWTNTTAAISTVAAFTDVLMDPTDPSVLYTAVKGQGIYKTTSGGQDWSPLSGGLPAGELFGKTRVAMSQASSDVLYVSVASSSNGGLFKFMRSDDAGTTWTDLTAGTPNYLKTQGWYDTTLAVDPTDPSIVYAAGASGTNSVIQSTNGGQTWSDIHVGANGDGVHVDHHGIGFDADGRLLDGNDGGIWRLDNATAGDILWTNLNGNLQITTFIGIALHPTDPNIAYGGSQDNGIEMFNDSLGWTLVSLGDGGNVRVNPTNPDLVYAEHATANYPVLERSVDGGRRGTFCFLTDPEPPGCDVTPQFTVNNELAYSNFYPPFVMDPSDGQRLLFGTDRVYETINGGNNWTAISAPGVNGWSIRARIGSLAAAPTDVDTIYAGAGYVFRSTDRGQTWTQTDPDPTSLNFRAFADLKVDPTDPQVVYAVASNFGSDQFAWRTDNGGQTWTNITSNLPKLPIWTLELDPKGPGSEDDVLYVGNDIGVYVSNNLGGSWTRFGVGLPNVQVNDLELNPALGILAAGTHGRGMWQISLVGTAENDDFTDAFTLTGSSVQTTGSNAGATKEPDEPRHADNSGGKSVWWNWTAPASGRATVSTTGSNFDTTLAVYTGTSVADLRLQAHNNDINEGVVQQSQVEFDAVGGTTYRIAVDGSKTGAGDTPAGSIALALNVTGATAPVNDDFADAGTLTGTSAQATGSNVGATKEPGEPNHAENFGGKSVWWNWTAPTSGNVTISTTGSNFDTTLAAYTGTSLGGLTLLAQNDDIDPGVLQESQIEFDAVGGTTYRIAVDGHKGVVGDAASGEISVSLNATVAGPVNDAFGNASALSGDSLTTAGSNVGATKEPGEPNHAQNVGGVSVWWNWTATGSGNVTISTSGSSFDTLLAVYTGASVDALTTVASNDDTVNSRQSSVSFDAVAGATYRIAVDGYGGDSGSITLDLNATLSVAPGNDDFADASTLSGDSATSNGTNVGATREAGEPNHAGTGGGKSVWWNWTAPAAGDVTISTNGSSFDTVLAVYTGTSVGSLTEVTSNDDEARGGPPIRTSKVTFPATAGTVYRLVVDGSGGVAGDITLSLSEALDTAPENDNFANALLLTGTSATATGANVNATKEASEPFHANNAGGKSVWWSWAAPTSGRVTISTTGSDYDTTLAVYTGTSVASLTLLAQNDDIDPGVVQQSQIEFNAVGGTTYRIAVDGYADLLGDAASGDISLSLTEAPGAPTNDDFADAFALNGISATAAGSNLGAAKEPFEPFHAGNAGGKSVWWNWTAPTSGRVTISTAGSDYDTTLGVYTGSSVDFLFLVAQNDDIELGVVQQSQVEFDALSGTVYRIAVDGYKDILGDAESGNITLSVDVAVTGPANDNSADAIALSGSSVDTSGSNQGATIEFWEPYHAGNVGGASVWWTWSAPASGSVTISTSGSDFDTLLAVYVGSDLTNLVEVASNDDIDSGIVLQSRVAFIAEAGQMYRIAVDGYNAETGNIVLALSQDVAAAPVNNDFANASLLSGASVTTTGTNRGATREFGEPDHANQIGGASVWWRWTAPSTGRVTISTAGSDFDTLLAIYTATAEGVLTEIMSNDDFGELLQSQVALTGVAGTTYHIAVDGYSGDRGNIALALTQASSVTPANDDLANAAVLTGSSPTAIGSNVAATRETGEPNHADTAGGLSVWWTWTALSQGPVTVSLAGSNFDTVLAAYTGTSVAALTEVASNDDFEGNLQSQIAFTAAAGTTYLIAVDGYSGTSGNIVLSLTSSGGEVLGDFDGNGLIEPNDANLLIAEIRSPNPELRFDLTQDGDVNDFDLRFLIHDVARSSFGDANLDGTFDSGDLVRVFVAGQYEDGIAGNSVWETGDWNGDGDFTSTDLVRAFQDGKYEVAAATIGSIHLQAAPIGTCETVHELQDRRTAGNERRSRSEVQESRPADLDLSCLDDLFAANDVRAADDSTADELVDDLKADWSVWRQGIVLHASRL